MVRVAKYIGTLLALGFIGYLFWRSSDQIPPVDFTAREVWLGLSGGLALYVISQFVGAIAWRATLNIYDVHLPRGWAESQLLISQIGKYVPGNVTQFIGRAFLARADGVRGAAIAGALLLEIGFLFSAAALAFGAVLLIAPDFLSGLTAGLPDGGLMGRGVALGAGVLVCVALGQFICWRRAGSPPFVTARFVKPVLLHLVNFAILGVSLWCVTTVTAPQIAIGIPHCIAIFTTAWLAGFLMPGAPGGVGVRDGIIAIGLELFVMPGAALGAAILHRALSVLGDVGIFGMGLALRRAQKVEPQLEAR